jgi:hypothetical protein
MRFAFAMLLAFSGISGCSSSDPDATGFPVVADGQCHQLQLEQCQCCEDGEPNCTAAVNYLAGNGKAWSNLTEEECKTLLEGALADSQQFCSEISKSTSRLQLACQGFPPGSGPQTPANDVHETTE